MTRLGVQMMNAHTPNANEISQTDLRKADYIQPQYSKGLKCVRYTKKVKYGSPRNDIRRDINSRRE